MFLHKQSQNSAKQKGGEEVRVDSEWKHRRGDWSGRGGCELVTCPAPPLPLRESQMLKSRWPPLGILAVI